MIAAQLPPFSPKKVLVIQIAKNGDTTDAKMVIPTDIIPLQALQ
jgi:hypothetical protein